MLHSLYHPAARQQERQPVLIMLHGRGADEHDLFGLKSRLDPRLDVYSLRAPYEFDWGGYTWFDLYDDGTVDEKSFHYSANEILSFIASLKRQEIFLLGFSMGAIMSYALALTRPKLCKGIMALSGFAPMQLESEYKLNELQDLQIFISHGTDDPVIPISSARKTREFLQRSNARISYNEYRMAHLINDKCLNDIDTWISTLLT
jgi:phospholipase/carboxylesterase